MQTLRSRPAIRRGGILYLSADELLPSPVQPRRNFDDEALRELCESIRNYGILNPLTVRLRSGRYELVAGERRLRAARMAGLRELPCILLDVDLEESTLSGLRFFLPRMAEGGYLLLHDYNNPKLPGVKRTAERYEAEFGRLRAVPLCDVNGTLVIST